jgi:hypothetical protein
MSDDGFKKKLIQIATLGGIVGVPAAATFTVVFLTVYYTEKEAVHMMRKRKWILPTISGLAAGAAVSVFIGSKILGGGLLPSPA